MEEVSIRSPIADLNYANCGGEIVAFNVGFDRVIYIVFALKTLDPSSQKLAWARFPKPNLASPQSYRIIAIQSDLVILDLHIAAEKFIIHDIQPLPKQEILLVCHRAGYKSEADFDKNGRIYNHNGEFIREIWLGDGIQSVRVTANGVIWTSFFDEGIFGNLGGQQPVGSSGLVAWDLAGNPVYKFHPTDGLGSISDCYALNVESDVDTWLYYYVQFPLVHINGKFGYIDANGKIVVKPQFVLASYFFDEGLAAVTVGDKWGYIDRNGKSIVKPIFSTITPFHNGLASVQVNDKWGCIDRTGQFKIEPRFKLPLKFSDGLALLSIDNGSSYLYGYINDAGKVVIKPQFHSAYSFSEGLAAVKIGDKFGYIDRSGKVKIEPQFELGSQFQAGIASVKTVDGWGYIDKSGRFIIKPQFDNVALVDNSANFSDGRSVVKIGDRWGYIDRTGKIIIKPQFDDAKNFVNGMASIEIAGEIGWIDLSGKIVIKPQFFIAKDFVDGMALVRVDGKWGWIDRTGKFAIKPQFDYAENFRGGLASVRVGNKLGWIDRTGKYIWQPSN